MLRGVEGIPDRSTTSRRPDPVRVVRPAFGATLLILMMLFAYGASLGAPGEIDEVIRKAEALEAAGDFLAAESVVDRAKGDAPAGSESRARLEFERERLDRIRRDFRLTRTEVLEALRARVIGFEEAEFEGWLADGTLDRRRIDGEERFFVSCVSNLFFRRPELEPRRRTPRETTALSIAYWENARSIRDAAIRAGSPYVLPKHFRVVMSLTLQPGAAVAGREVAAWLPVPRRFPHQSAIEILRTVPAERRIGSEDDPARSVFLRQPAPAHGAARFEVEYRYRAHGVWFDLDPDKARPIDAGAASLKPFLEPAPHVEFSPAMRELAAKWSAGESHPVRRARRFYEEIARGVRYSYAPEYSTVRNLGEACRRDRRGDCGQAAFLFMTLCRLTGIPARWQSGWALFPGDETIHDWCEAYFEPWGWVPVDPYMGMYAMQYTPGLEPARREELRDFYFGGLTQHRMAANADHHQALKPAKRSFRSDPVDFQRGEVEVDDGNLYFDRFRYELRWEEVPAW